jgi:hypothetical protein
VVFSSITKTPPDPFQSWRDFSCARLPNRKGRFTLRLYVFRARLPSSYLQRQGLRRTFRLGPFLSKVSLLPRTGRSNNGRFTPRLCGGLSDLAKKEGLRRSACRPVLAGPRRLPMVQAGPRGDRFKANRCAVLAGRPRRRARPCSQLKRCCSRCLLRRFAHAAR